MASKQPEYLTIRPLGEGECDVHDWPTEGFPRRLVQAMRDTHPKGINACFECVNRAKAEADRERGIAPVCLCDCPTGECAHDWSGPRETFEDGSGDTVTCVHCGMWAINHDMRVLP